MKPKINSHKDLIVWQKSIKLVEHIFLLTEHFPKSELYGITSEMRRSSVSIPSNIAEGFGRRSLKENNHYFLYAYGSSLELETQLILSKNLNLCDSSLLVNSQLMLDEVYRMLNSLTKNTSR